MAIPGMDSVLDGYGRIPGPMDRRDVSFSFRVFTNDGDLDKAYDLLAAAIAPGYPVRLVYTTDAGEQWFTVGSNPSIKHTLTSANNWNHGGYCDFVVAWRIRPDWWTRYSENVSVWPLVPTTFHVANDEVFSNLGTTAITSANQNFTLNATGTAGIDLPTLPDTAAKIYIVGPAGGDAGIGVSSFTATARDGNGIQQPVFFTLSFKLPTANDSVSLDLGAQSFSHNGVPFRPYKPSYQPHYFRVDPGVVNSGVVTAFGANPLTGGSITVDWRRKRV